MGGNGKPVVRPMFSRDLELYREVREGKPLSEVADRYGITVRGTMKRYGEMKRFHDSARLGYALDKGFAQKLQEVGVHTLIDLKRFIDGNSDWRGILARRCGFQEGSISQMERFAKENGIEVREIPHTDEARIKDAVARFARERGIREKDAYGMFAEVCQKGLGK